MKPKKVANWRRLDNAAKIFPSASSKDRTQVFRFTCELYEPIEHDILQQAVDRTIQEFPIYKSVLKQGLFWYYLEESNLKPIVKLEDRPPCSPIYDKNQKTLLFEVLYYKNRIHLEVYHALSDGTGAMQFLRAMVSHYLEIKYNEQLSGKMVSIDYDASDIQKSDDSFQKYYSNKKRGKKKKKGKLAYRLKGPKYAENRIKVIEGIMPVHEVLEKAHEYKATITSFLAAILLRAIREDMPAHEKKKPVVLGIPVNLRNYFYSESVRNFFRIINIEHDLNDNDLESVVRFVDIEIKKELTVEKLADRINILSSIERNVFARIIPLFIKNIILRIAYNSSTAEATAIVSNMGIVSMPKELWPYIRLFDVCVSTNRFQICMCSYCDNLTISFTSPYISSEIQKAFFRTLSGMGIKIDIVTNQVDVE